MSMLPMPTDDIGVDQATLARRRAMAQALLQNSQQPVPSGQMVGRHFVATNPLQYAAQLLRGVSAQRDLAMTDADEKALAQRLRDRNAEDVNAYLAASRGTPARTIQPLTPMDDDGNPNQPAQADAVPPDQAKALAIAMRSRNPVLQGIGAKQLESDAEVARIKAMIAGLQGGGSGGGAPGSDGAGANPLGGVDPTAAALTMMGGNAAKVGEMVAAANKPIPLREGDLVRPDGKGGFTSVYTQPKLPVGMQPVRDASGRVTGAGVIPGYTQGLGDITRATEEAKSGFEMVTVETPDGPRMMTKAQAAQLSGGAQPSAAAPRGPMALPGGPAQGAGYNGGDRNAANAESIRMIQAEMQNPNLPAADREAMGREILRLQQQSGAAPAAPGAGGPGIALQDESQKNFGKTVAAKSAEALLDGRDKAKSAADDIMAVRQARAAVKAGVYQGSLADIKLNVAKFAQGLGINIDPEKIANTDYLKSTLGAGMLAQAKTLGANPSNADAQRIEDIVGSIGKDPNAMARLLDWRESMAIRAIEGHNSTVQDAEKRGMKSMYDLRVKLPEGGSERPNPANDLAAAAAAELARRQRAQAGGR